MNGAVGERVKASQVGSTGASWADALFGSAVFTKDELAGDDRLRGLVARARTKPTRAKAKRA